MKYFILFLIMVSSSSIANAQESAFLIFIDNQANPEIVQMNNFFEDNVVVEPEIGVWQEKFVIQLDSTTSGEIKIEQQTETSLTIGDDGPHLDLTDWRHQTSEWRELKKIGTNRWQGGPIERSEEFPAFSVSEVQNEITEQLKDYPAELGRWLTLAQQCTPPFNRSCSIAPSRILLKISTKQNGNWLEYKNIEIKIPMGC